MSTHRQVYKLLLTRGGMLKALAEKMIMDVARVKSDLHRDGCNGPNICNSECYGHSNIYT